MKIFKAIATFVVCAGLMIGTNSCSVHVFKRGDGSKHGWHKNPNNPHHPNTTNPGHTKSPSPGKSKGKAPKGPKK
jgi:hypothetical protein